MKKEKREELYDELSRVLTDYEKGFAGDAELYDILVKVQVNWEELTGGYG